LWLQSNNNKARTDSDQIFNRSVTVYDVGHMHAASRTFMENTSEYTKIPFKMVLPEVVDGTIGVPGIGENRLPLPPSFCHSRLQKSRYM
jgi:hypothetical protein